MAATTAFITSLLNHLFLNAEIANVGDATGLRGSTTAGSLYLSLHTASPGVGGSQTTSECSYTSYARVAVVRTASGFEISSGDMVNAAAVTFPANTGSTQNATHIGLGTAASGAGNLLLFTSLSSTLAITNGLPPNFLAGEIVFRVT